MTNKMLRLNIFGLFAFVALTLFPVQNAHSDSIKIGASMPLTGNFAVPGSKHLEGYQMCVDIINRGPKSLETIEFLYSIKKNCHITLGNHDLHFLAVAEGVKEISDSDTFQTILEEVNLDIYVIPNLLH